MSNIPKQELNTTAIDQLIKGGLLVESLTFPNLPMAEAVTNVIHSAGILAFLNSVHPGAQEQLEALVKVIHAAPHGNRVTEMTSVHSVLIFLTLVACILRLYSRRKLTKHLWPDDWWAVASVFGAVVFYVGDMITLHLGGAERHIYDISFEELQTTIKFILINEIVFSITLIPVKMTFVVFYYRLVPDRIYRRVLKAIAFLIVLNQLTSAFIALFQCHPVDYWNHLFTRKCLNLSRWTLILGTSSAVIDIALLLMPIVKVSTLQIRNRKEKIMVIGMFAAGGLVIIANIFRILYTHTMLLATDVTYALRGLGFSCSLELDFAILVSCLPALRHILVGKKAAKSLTFLRSKIIRSSRSKPTSESIIILEETDAKTKSDLESGTNRTIIEVIQH